MKIEEDADMPFNFQETAIVKINSSKGGYNTECITIFMLISHILTRHNNEVTL